MSAIHLDKIDEHVVKQIVKKFEPCAGANFYRSCRGAKDLVERTKPAWSIRGVSCVSYENNQRFTPSGIGVVDQHGISFRAISGNIQVKIPVEFCRIAQVRVPEITGIGCIMRVHLRKGLSDEDLQLLLAAAKTNTVWLDDKDYDATSVMFKNVRNLCVYMHKDRSHWTKGKILELARDKKTLTFLPFNSAFKGIVTDFVKDWLNGEFTGSLEKLTLQNCAAWSRKEDKLLRNNIEKLMGSRPFTKTSKEYMVERDGHRLRICFNSGGFIFDFHLS